MLDHRGNEVVGDRVHRADTGERHRTLQAQPGREPGVGQAAGQRRVAADQFDLVQQQAPAGIACGVEQQAGEADALRRQFRRRRHLQRRTCAARRRSPAPGGTPRLPSARRPGIARSGARSPAAAAGRRSRNRIAAKTGARRLSGPRTAASSASNRSGTARNAARAPARASSLRPGRTALRIAASYTRAGSASGVSLLTTTRLTTKLWVRRDLAEIGQHVRLAGAEAASDAEAARRRTFRPDRVQQLVERRLDAGLRGAHQAHGGAVGHAGAQGFDGDAGFQVHPLTVTSGASGFCRSPGRTSGQMRISSAL